MEYYDELAEGYEELHRKEQEEKLEIIIPLIQAHVHSETRLLDIGCGTGISLEPWPCYKIGVDPSKGLLAIAKKKILEVKQAGAENLPFKNQSFDICLALTSLHHADINKAVEEVHRVCKDLFVMTVLKKSDLAKKNIKTLIRGKFKLIEKHDSPQDWIYVLKRI